MEEFAHRQNVERFEHALAHEPDPKRRDLLERLLAEERQHLKRLWAERNQRY